MIGSQTTSHLLFQPFSYPSRPILPQELLVSPSKYDWNLFTFFNLRYYHLSPTRHSLLPGVRQKLLNRSSCFYFPQLKCPLYAAAKVIFLNYKFD